MEFGLSEFQVQLQDSLNRFLDERAALDDVRKWVASCDPHSAALWDGLAELGVPGILVPEEFGGIGLSVLDAALVSECLGHHVTPGPFVAAAVGARAIAQGGSERQKHEMLESIATGSRTLGLALSELSSTRGPAGVRSDGELLSGTARFVSDPRAKSHLICDENRRLYILDSSSNAVVRTAMPNIDGTRGLCFLHLEGAEASLLPGSNDSSLADSVLDLARVLLAADTLGAAQFMCDQAVDYSKQRTQFNRPVGSFQAVKHMCAEMVAELEPARSFLWFAAHAQDHDPSQSRLAACHAKAHTSEMGTRVARASTEVHGGMGFTDVLGLHFWFKRIGYNRQYLGGPDQVREEAARVQGLV